ncbi:MAG: D-alanine--D-alanine ligase [Phycisphaeraceae bacterium]|nr:D-alanine--D-alanine ligase [Phycisphaeraceae bacterium]
MKHVLVLGGGPDREREVSLNSSRAIADALERFGYRVRYEVIERIGVRELRALPGEVVFPALHGAFGEGGPLQEIMEVDGRPYVGSRARAARAAMDKMASKLEAARLGIPTAEACVVNRSDSGLPIPIPLVMKPVHDGSSVGLHLCVDDAAYERARREVDRDIDENPGRAYIAERMIRGRELTQTLIAADDDGGDLEAMDAIEIVPAEGAYDYDAKYVRNDTRYVVKPDLPGGLAGELQAWSVRLARSMGVRHVCRVDYLLEQGADGVRAWFLEINTMPGFTDHSLVPKAAAYRGIDMGTLCDRLVRAASRDHMPGGGR